MKWINFILAKDLTGVIKFYTNTWIHGRKWKTKHNKITFQQLDSRGDIETSVEQCDFLQHKYDKLLHCYLSRVVNSDPSSSLKKPVQNNMYNGKMHFNIKSQRCVYFNQRQP